MALKAVMCICIAAVSGDHSTWQAVPPPGTSITRGDPVLDQSGRMQMASAVHHLAASISDMAKVVDVKTSEKIFLTFKT